jgi:photosystem II stability/assembly factor-like uncharacterized protein
MGLLIGTSEGTFILARAGAPAPAAGLSGPSVHVFRQVNGSILAGASDGLHRSADGGRNWRPSGCAGEDVWSIAASPVREDLIFAGVHPAGLFRSEDGGEIWASVPAMRNVPGSDNWRLPSDPNGSRALAIALDANRVEHLYVGVEVGGIVETSDGGSTWMIGFAGRNPDIHGLALDPVRPDVIYAATGYGRLEDDDPMETAGVYRSNDGGESWEYTWPDPDRRWTKPMCLDPRAPHALTVAGCPDFQSSYRKPEGAQSMLYQTIDGANSWRPLGDAAHAPSNVNITAVAVAAEAPGTVVVGMENGEVWQVSPEAEWTPLATGLPPVQALLALA